MTTSDERRAVYRLTRTAAPLVLRTWHAVEFTDGGMYSGLRGFLIGRCPENGNLFRVKRAGADVIVCCVPLSRLTGFPTMHGGVMCPGDHCAEGEAL